MGNIGEAASSRSFELEGARIHYHDVGKGEPLLLLQAYGPLPGTTSWLTYHRVIDSLAARFRCILLDYPNFGRSSPVVFDEPVHDLYVRHALALLDHLGLHRVMVVGTSTGGTVAIDLALTAPDRVARMVIGACEASTGGDPYLLAPWPSEVARLAQECQSLPADEERIRRFLAAMVYDERALPEGLAGQMYNWRLDQPEHADAWSRSTSVPAGNLSKLAAIRQDVLIIHGRFDRMVPLEGAVRLLNYLPSSDLIALNRCGHWPAMERPDEFATYVMNFM